MSGLSPTPASPEHTHALIVGIERYAAGERWKLDGPVNDALAMRGWLLRKGVPGEQIHLHLSPLPENEAKLATLPQTPRQATDQDLRETISQLKRLAVSQAKLLILYWAGHGVISQSRHCLLLANAKEEDWASYEVENLRQTFSCVEVKGFPQQIYLFDACRSFHRQPENPPPSLNLPVGEPKRTSQFLFLASQQGEAAINSGPEKAGVFTRVLLEKLNDNPALDAGWPPDMKQWAEAVQASFQSKKGLNSTTCQYPVYQWIVDWAGNETQDPIPSFASSPLSDQALGLPDAIEQLARLLAEHLGQPTQRTDLLKWVKRSGQVGCEIFIHVERRENAQDDYLQIIDECLGHEEGLKILGQTCLRMLGQKTSAKAVDTAFQNLRIARDAHPREHG